MNKEKLQTRRDYLAKQWRLGGANMYALMLIGREIDAIDAILNPDSRAATLNLASSGCGPY